MQDQEDQLDYQDLQVLQASPELQVQLVIQVPLAQQASMEQLVCRERSDLQGQRDSRD